MPRKKQSEARRNTRIDVYALPEEHEIIKQNAKAAGMSASSYLLAVGIGYRITGILDYEKVADLSKANGDLGRLGGLLKLWLTNNEKLNQFQPDKLRATINLALDKILENQDQLKKIIAEVVNK